MGLTGEDLKEITVALEQLENAYRVTLKPEVLQAYMRGLEDLSMAAVRQGIERVVRTSKVFPTIAAIREACSAGRVESSGGTRRGTFPPDIAARRRELGLPVTPEEFVEYERQTHEGGERRLTKLERAAILRTSIENTKSVVYRTAVIDLAERLERGEDVPDEEFFRVFTGAMKGRSTRT